jgi:hypothetical protein
MGDPQLDESIAHLEAFNSALAGAKLSLAEAADELAAVAKQLQQDNDVLQTAVAAAREDVSSAGQEVATLALAVETETETLADSALNEVSAALESIDARARELAESVPHEIEGRARALDQDAEALQEQGFAPLHETMNLLARSAWGGWAAAAEEALGRLDGRVEALTAELRKGWSALVGDDRWSVLYTEDASWMSVGMAIGGVESDIPAEAAQAPLATDLNTLYGRLLQETHTATAGLRSDLSTVSREIGAQVAQRALALVDAVAAVLEAYERGGQGVADAEQDAVAAGQRAAGLEVLAEEVGVAEGELREVQTVLHAMDAP